MDDSKLVVVHTFGSRQEADLAASALAAADIEAIVRADTGGGMQPSIAWAGVGVQVIVRAEDAEAARAILEQPARSMPD
jgi:Putative prokaryotic signal transducing protein